MHPSFSRLSNLCFFICSVCILSGYCNVSPCGLYSIVTLLLVLTDSFWFNNSSVYRFWYCLLGKSVLS